MDADAVFNRSLNERDLAAIVEDWLLYRHGLRMITSVVTIGRDGVTLDTASVKAEACSRCEPEMYLRIRRLMDSKLQMHVCPKCGFSGAHAFFSSGKSDDSGRAV